MNIEQIGEPIQVLAAFSGGSAKPLRFRWKGRAYTVDALNAQWVDRQGDDQALHFSLQVGAETCHIHFSSRQTQWWLDEIIV
jgi:hypothetical protein